MEQKRLKLLALSMAVVGLVGCRDIASIDSPRAVAEDAQTTETTQLETLYRNEAFGVTISPDLMWDVDTVEVAESLKVTFKRDNVRAIVSSVSDTQTFDTVKAELLSGAGDVDVLKDNEDVLTYRSKLKSAIQTSVYYMAHPDDHGFVIIFMFLVADGDDAQPIIDSLLDHITIE